MYLEYVRWACRLLQDVSCTIPLEYFNAVHLKRGALTSTRAFSGSDYFSFNRLFFSYDFFLHTSLCERTVAREKYEAFSLGACNSGHAWMVTNTK